jgi:arylsulfatase A-like enzyme
MMQPDRGAVRTHASVDRDLWMNRTSRPNVVFVFADEWRAQATGYNGDPNVDTPALDRLAGEAVDVTAAVAGCPVCCVYRASLLTGQYPLSHGVVINDVPLAADAPSLARMFNAADYDTAWIGKWHLYGSPGGRNERRRDVIPRSHQMGFDLFAAGECCHDYWNSFYTFNDEPELRTWEGYDAFAQTDMACDYLRDPARRQRPFFMTLSWGPPHFPMQTAPEAYRDRYQPEQMQLRPNVPEAFAEQARQDLAGLSAHIAALDDCVARLLATLEQTGLDENTIFIFTSDHGSQHHSQGINFKLVPFDESVRVPFLLRWPAGLGREGHPVAAPIDAPDIMPTLAGLCGLEPPATTEGRDWSAALRGRQRPTEDDAALLIAAAPFTALRWYGLPAYRGLRTGRHTYVVARDRPLLLFDNAADPFQMNNLVDAPEATALRQRLEKQLRQRLATLGDPFEDGDAMLQRLGLDHYNEVNQPLRRQWADPWPDEHDLRGAWTFDAP